MEKTSLKNAIFYCVTLGEGNNYMFPALLNGMGSWLSSRLQIQKFLSLDGVENPKRVELYGGSRSKKIVAKMIMIRA